MSRGQQLARLFQLADILGRAKVGLPVARIAKKEGWKLRTVYRDLEALQLAGVPVVGIEGKYRLVEGWVPAAQLGVAGDELLALHVAGQQAAGWTGTRIAEALQRLHGKLATAKAGTGTLVPPGLGEGFSAPAPAARKYTEFRNIVSVLDRACREHRVVKAVYRSLDGDTTPRSIEPAQLHWEAQLETLYLIAWCRLRNDIRVFATHRFLVVSPEKETFAPRPDVSSRAALRNAFRVWRAAKVTPVKLRFTGRAARLVGERRWCASEKKREDGDGALLFEAEVAGLEEITAWILSYGPDCVVLEPVELRTRVREAHARAAEMRLDAPARRRSPTV